jgi:TRAP-type C4-dicarboxylate transport system substrate-binding protein
MSRRIVFAALCAALTVALAGPAGAQTVVKWTSVAGSPPHLGPLKVMREQIIPEINRRIVAENRNFKIEWTEAYAQSLAKFTEVFEAIEEGIAHYGLNFTNFEESKLPLEQYVRVVPFGIRSATAIMDIDAAIRKQVPQMDATWVKHNQYRLSSAGNTSLGVLTNFPVTKLDDLKGHKIGASGSFANYLRGTGAVVVNAAMAESYTDIRNGLYDGYVISVVLAFPFRTYQVAKHYTDVGFGSTITPTVSVNKAAFDKLPDWAQKIVREASANYGPSYAAFEVDRDRDFTEQMKKQGVTFTELPAADRKRWAAGMPNLPKEWAESAEAKGFPGKKVLAAYMSELRKRNVDTVRDWDKE